MSHERHRSQQDQQNEATYQWIARTHGIIIIICDFIILEGFPPKNWLSSQFVYQPRPADKCRRTFHCPSDWITCIIWPDRKTWSTVGCVSRVWYHIIPSNRVPNYQRHGWYKRNTKYIKGSKWKKKSKNKTTKSNNAMLINEQINEVLDSSKQHWPFML